MVSSGQMKNLLLLFDGPMEDGNKELFIICSTSEFQKENMKRNAKESAEFHTVPFCRIEVCADKWMLQRRQQSACASRQCTAPSSAPRPPPMRPTLRQMARHHQQHHHWYCYLDQNKSERRVFFFEQATRGLYTKTCQGDHPLS